MSSFHNGTNYEYYFIIKELAGNFFSKFTCSRKNTKKITIFTVLIEKESRRTDKNGEDFFEKIYPSYYNSFISIAQDLWQAYQQTFSTTFLQEFMKLYVNADTMTKKICKLLE